MSDENLIKKFCMTKDDVRILLSLFNQELVSRGKRQSDISAEQKILISLKTLASGSFQNSVKDSFPVSQSTVSKCLTEFVQTISKKANQFIYMPRTSSEREIVDRRHIPIVTPVEDAYAYVAHGLRPCTY